MITWSHIYRTKHLNRWIMGSSPPLQQNHPLHLPLDVWVSLSFSLSPPSPPPHHSFMFVRVSNRERTHYYMASLINGVERSSFITLCCCEFCYRGSPVHEYSPGTTQKKPFNSLNSHCPVHNCKIIVFKLFLLFTTLKI